MDLGIRMLRMPRQLLKAAKSVFFEVLILFAFILTINNYLGNVDRTTNADGVGYYDYLPSFFIHHDLVRKHATARSDTALYQRVQELKTYIDYKGYKVDKYPAGTAVLQLPFFLHAWLTTDRDGSPEDGYQKPFQVAVFHAALFYLFFSLFFLKKLLKLYNVRQWAIVFTQLLLVMATGVVHYSNVEAGFSHVYSLFAITAFLYYSKSYFSAKNLNHYFLAALFLGLIVLIRQINILIVLFLPFMAGSWATFREGITALFRNPLKFGSGILIMASISCIQCLFWYLQTGHFFLYSYQGEGFNFSNPEFVNILFSYRKGLFIYTPVLFISLFGIVFLAIKKKFYLMSTWLAFFLILTYILSSWHSWYYGCSFGLRAYIDFYAIFFIPFALLLSGSAIWISISFVAISLFTIPVNIIQAYQYKNYILHWILMDKEMYWKVFLNTSDNVKDLLWKRQYDYSAYSSMRNHFISDLDTKTGSSEIIYSASSKDIPDFGKVSIIQFRFDNDFNKKNNSRIMLNINEKEGNRNVYSHSHHLLEFSEKEFNTWHTGWFDFEFKPLTDTVEKVITIRLETGNQENYLRRMQVRYLLQK